MVLKDLHEGAVSGHVGGEEKMLGLLRVRGSIGLVALGQ